MKIIFVFTTFILIATSVIGQAPASFKYQAVLRDSRGNIKTNTATNIKIDILQESADGTIVYTETHKVTTDDYGLINLNIGTGTAILNSLSAINWGVGIYFVKVTVDGVEMGTAQLLSVPYALYANTAGNSFSGNYNDLTNKPLLFDGTWSSLTSKPTIATVATSGSYNDLSNKPIFFDGTWLSLIGKPILATVASSGSYANLTNLPTGNSTGDMKYWNGTEWVMIPIGQAGQYLQLSPSSIPSWTGAAYATISTTAISLITQTTVTSGGIITSDGGATITARGVCWSTTTNPTIILSSKTSDGTGTVSFTSSITGLTAGTTYYVRAYASNSVGTSYGTQVSFITLPLVVPILTTSTATLITSTTATSGGNITNDGGASVTVRGVVWSTTANPTIVVSTKTTNGTGTGPFTSSITGLTVGTHYYIRAYATNSVGTSYGTQVNFTTLAVIPTLASTTSASLITQTTATSGGNITYDGGASVTARGVCWSTIINPTIALATKTVDGTAIGTFISSITGLTAGTIYYVRAYATNSVGTSYGTQVSFITLPLVVPVLTTTTATSIATTTATSGGNISSDGGASVTVRGVCWSTTANPTIALSTKTTNGTGTGTFTSSITGLTAGTLYYVRAYATNNIGTSYGTQVSLTTLAVIPTLAATTAATSITSATATSGGNVTSDGGATVTARGVCWSMTANPSTALSTKTTDGTGTGAFTSNITGLTANTLYYIRAYATNSVGTAYGTQVSFTTSSASATVTDIDGNVYNTVTIGTQVWMAENLKTTKYSDGTPINLVNTVPTWNALTTSSKAYCWYNDDISNKSVNGALYTWAAAMNGAGVSTSIPSTVQGVCPTGWHLPSWDEWGVLIKYLDPNSNPPAFLESSIAGGKMKETGTTHWQSPNTGATNEVGFTALPSGGRGGDGVFLSISTSGLWWSTSQYGSVGYARVEDVDYNSSNNFMNSTPWDCGISVRCIQGAGLAVPSIDYTIGASSIAQTTATSGGNITNDGGATVTARGVCWSTSANPNISNSKTSDGTGTGTFTSSITGLIASTIYYVRAYATNSVGTSYGTQVSFTTSSASETVTDIDGNTYNTVTIGTQVWMKENLKTTKYNDGTLIPNITDGIAWSVLTTGAYCDYDNTPSNSTTYGRLYNWYTVDNNAATKVASNGGKNVCPTGWHIPTDVEWTTLTDYLTNNSYGYGGSGNLIAKSMASTSGWNTDPTAGNVGNDQPSNNSSGFTALPAGSNQEGNFSLSLWGNYSYWWSSTPMGNTRLMTKNYNKLYTMGMNTSGGFSVRCLKD